MTGRAAPFYCPFCGGENLWPHVPESPESPGASSAHGEWECRSCLRAFRLNLIGHLRRPVTPDPLEAHS